MKPSTLLAAVCAILLAVSATAAFNFQMKPADELADELARFLKLIHSHQPPDVTDRTLPLGRGTRKSKPGVDLQEKRKEGKESVTCSVAWYPFCSSCRQSKSDEKCSNSHKRFVKACFMKGFRGVTPPQPQDFRIETLFNKYCPN